MFLKVLGTKRDSRVDNDSFVKKMNQRNLELTAKRKKEDEAKQKRSPLIRRVMSNASSAVEMVNMNSQSCFSPFTDNYKLKSRTFTTEPSRLSNFHHSSNNTHTTKFETPQSVNYVVGGYTTPSNYTFPPQPFLCSSPRQLPNVAPNAQNYLTMYSRPPMHSPMPPFSSFNSPSIPPLPSFPPQPPPSIHRSIPQAMHPSMPQFSNFNPLSGLPLPTSLAQPSFFPCTDAQPVPQQAFIPLNVRPSLSASFHPQFVLPPPPPPPPPATQRDMSRADRRGQSSHQTSSFYPNSPYNS